MQYADRDNWKQEFDVLVAAVTNDLAVVTGDPWQHEPGEGIFNYLTCGQQKVTARKGGNRIRFSGWYPRLEKTVGSYEEFGLTYGEEHAVTCGMNRGALAIAKDVARRFLPDYERYWQRGLEERAEYQEQVAQVVRQAERLTEAWQIPVVQRYDDREATGKYEGSTDLCAIVKLQHYDGGRVSLDIYSLSVEEAAQIGLLLREMREVERGELPVADDGPCEVLDGAIETAMAMLDGWLYDPEPEVDGYTRDRLLDSVRDLCRGLVLTGLEMAALVNDENGVGSEK